MTPSHDAVHASACENCQTPLQGGFCHVCGQNAHNPLRSFGHAVEEVFESFWHLDGRIFRTLRTLLSPGRLANAYLAGHRAPYVAPLRLFVILSVLTFFVGKFAMGSGDVLSPPAVADGKGGTTVQVTGAGGEGVDFASLTDPDEVVRLRDRTIDGLLAARRWSGRAGLPLRRGRSGCRNRRLRPLYRSPSRSCHPCRQERRAGSIYRRCQWRTCPRRTSARSG